MFYRNETEAPIAVALPGRTVQVQPGQMAQIPDEYAHLAAGLAKLDIPMPGAVGIGGPVEVEVKARRKA